jgi:predicted RecA/RadA family phage recombinase
MKNFKGHGSTVEWTNGGSAVLSGAVVIAGDLVGIAAVDIGAGATGTVSIEGVFEVACNASDTITQGMTLTWDASASEFVDTNTPASGDNAGGVVAMENDRGALVNVKLLPGSGATT